MKTLTLLLLLLTITACGVKGELYLPDPSSNRVDAPAAKHEFHTTQRY